jgi:hypothetical protein
MGFPSRPLLGRAMGVRLTVSSLSTWTAPAVLAAILSGIQMKLLDKRNKKIETANRRTF